MRIIQLIDTLEIGGAEKMAVNFANALAEKVAFSGLVASRREGILLEQLHNPSHYLFLGKKHALDLKAVLKLKAFCKQHQIDYIQAHGTSFFLAFLVKLLHPRIGILFHDHSGARSGQTIRQNRMLWIASLFFSGIVVVNKQLENWALTHLKCKKVLALPNFTTLDAHQKQTLLKGETGKKIVCLANLRHPKNHEMLIKAAVLLKTSHPDWSFHLVGKDNQDDYSDRIKQMIGLHQLDKHVFLYGQKRDTAALIDQASVCVLTSLSEGLPVALLEYGLLKKAVVATAVGEIPLLVHNGENGFTVPPDDVEALYKSLVKLIDNPALRSKFGTALFATLSERNSKEAVMNRFLQWLRSPE